MRKILPAAEDSSVSKKGRRQRPAIEIRRQPAGPAFFAQVDVDDLAQVRRVHAFVQEVNVALEHEVVHARSHGATWEAIGDVLGVRADAARKRFAAAVRAHGFDGAAAH